MLQRLEFHAMGCEMLAVVEAESPSRQLRRVPEWFEEWEQVLSRFRIDSEVTRLNHSAGQPVPVSPTLWDVFQCARRAEQMTNGLVTPTLLDALREAGYDRSFEELAHRAALNPVSDKNASVSLQGITANPTNRTLSLPHGMGLDFGGVAKGWAAHQAMQRLQGEGPALVDAGGDIAISGLRADGSLWQIGVADPFDPGEEIEILFAGEGGIATSGKDRRRWSHDGLLRHHIIDPLTSLPAETDLLTVTVIAPNVMRAEAAAKAAFLLGSRAGLEWIDMRPELAALLIQDDGQVIYSQRMTDYVPSPEK